MQFSLVFRARPAHHRHELIFLDETFIWQYPVQRRSVFAPGQLRKPVHVRSSRGARWSVIHAGGANGWVPNALWLRKGDPKGPYKGTLSGELFEEWVRTHLIPNLHGRRCWIVMDNASFHQRCVTPLSSMTVKQMRRYLLDHGVKLPLKRTKDAFTEVMKKNHFPQSIVAGMLAAAGHGLVRLPPYFPRMNAIENIWASVKQRLNLQRGTLSLTSARMEGRITSVFDTVIPQQWNDTVQACWRFIELFARTVGIDAMGELVKPDGKRATTRDIEEKAGVHAAAVAAPADDSESEAKVESKRGEPLYPSKGMRQLQEALKPTRIGRKRSAPLRLEDLEIQHELFKARVRAPPSAAAPAQVWKQ